MEPHIEFYELLKAHPDEPTDPAAAEIFTLTDQIERHIAELERQNKLLKSRCTVLLAILRTLTQQLKR